MSDKVKGGQDILIEFFSEISNIEGIDQDVATIIRRLYVEDKLTNINISNEFSEIRERKQHD